MSLIYAANTAAAIVIKKGKEKMNKYLKNYKFKKDNQIVKSWVSLVLAGKYTIDQVPALGNLREMVIEILEVETDEGGK